MAELLLDSDIRFWVFLPIVVVTFLVGIIRHYITILLTSDKKVEMQQIIDSQALIRSRMLRENGHFIPRQAFNMRKRYFNDEETGFFKTQKREAPMKNPMTDPSMMTDMLKGNVTNVLPMIVIGGWINWAFSGFLTTKVPFPLTLRFKPMLQRGVELASLDASCKKRQLDWCNNWLAGQNYYLGVRLNSLLVSNRVSSASWYFLNVFGLRSMYNLILGHDNAADQTKMMQDQMSGAAMSMPQDSIKAFKSEWETLEIVDHQWALEGVEDELTGAAPATDTIYIQKFN